MLAKRHLAVSDGWTPTASLRSWRCGFAARLVDPGSLCAERFTFERSATEEVLLHRKPGESNPRSVDLGPHIQSNQKRRQRFHDARILQLSTLGGKSAFVCSAADPCRTPSTRVAGPPMVAAKGTVVPLNCPCMRRKIFPTVPAYSSDT